MRLDQWVPIDGLAVLERLILELGDERIAAQTFLELEGGALYGTSDGRMLRYDAGTAGFQQRSALPIDEDADGQCDLLRRIAHAAQLMERSA